MAKALKDLHTEREQAKLNIEKLTVSQAELSRRKVELLTQQHALIIDGGDPSVIEAELSRLSMREFGLSNALKKTTEDLEMTNVHIDNEVYSQEVGKAKQAEKEMAEHVRRIEAALADVLAELDKVRIEHKEWVALGQTFTHEYKNKEYDMALINISHRFPLELREVIMRHPTAHFFKTLA